MLVTACPLCRYNLMNGDGLPVVYFTELLAEALGVKEEAIAMMNRTETKWSKAAANKNTATQNHTAAGGEQHA